MLIPNAASLVAALCLATTAFVVSLQVMELFPYRRDFGLFIYINVIIGTIVGWHVMGRRIGRGRRAGLANGFTGVLTMVFWGLFVQGAYEMFQRALLRRYDDWLTALFAIFEIGVEYAWMMARPDILIVLLASAVVTGLLCEYVSTVWR